MPLSGFLPPLIDEFPAIALTGPRQVGKTTLALSIMEGLQKDSIYLDLENPSDVAKLADPMLFFEQFAHQTVIIDDPFPSVGQPKVGISGAIAPFPSVGQRGIVLKKMDEHVDRLRHRYGYLYKGSNVDAIATSISKILDPGDSSLNELISKANAGIRKVLGEQGARPYLILGNKGEAYSIDLERNLIIWP